MPSIPNIRGGGWPSPRKGGRALPHIPVPVARAVVDCAIYVDGLRMPGHFSYTEALATVRERGEGFVWLGLHEPDDAQMQGVGAAFGLHELMVEDAVHAHQRPKLEVYDETQFLVVRTVSYVEHSSMAEANEVVETGEIMVFVGADFVITVRHGEHTHLSGVRHRLESRPEQLALGPTMVLHSIADRVVDSYLAVVARMDDDVDAIEEWVFGRGSLDIAPVYLLKREVLEMRRAVAPLVDPIAALTAPNQLIPKEVRRYMRDVGDHLTTVVDRVVEYDAVLSSLLDAAAAKVALQQNTDMRKISAWVAMAAGPTMIAGIYGMNFDNMPELHWHYSYFAVLSAMVLVTVVLWRNFRKHDWL